MRGGELFYDDKDSKGCEIAPICRTPVAKRVLQIRHHGLAMSLVPCDSHTSGFGFGRQTDTLSRSGIESKRGELEA